MGALRGSHFSFQEDDRKREKRREKTFLPRLLTKPKAFPQSLNVSDESDMESPGLKPL
jgi:hypothetical protein